MQVSVAWFALRQGQAWAWWVLVASDLIFIAGWGLVFSRNVAAGAPIIGGTILPLNLLLPAALLIPAAILGWVGLQSGSGPEAIVARGGQGITPRSGMSPDETPPPTTLQGASESVATLVRTRGWWLEL